MNHIAIKNLSIACEALSRINGERSVEQLSAVQQLLDDEISAAVMEKRKPKPRTQAEIDDEIPF